MKTKKMMMTCLPKLVRYGFKIISRCALNDCRLADDIAYNVVLEGKTLPVCTEFVTTTRINGQQIQDIRWCFFSTFISFVECQ